MSEYFRLRDEYVLRGYKKCPGLIIKRPQNRYKILTGDELTVLLLCDGKRDLESVTPLFTNTQRKILDKVRRAGIVEVKGEPDPVGNDQIYKIYPNRFFGAALWSVTGKCNLKCRHCYMGAPEDQTADLSHEEAMSFIDSADECGILKIDITGGEPFVREDIWDIIDGIREKNIWSGQIYTNGSLLDEKTLDEFEKRSMRPEFCFSFDLLFWHDWMRRSEGTEKQMLDAVRLCVKRGYAVGAESCVHRGNLPFLRESVKLMSELGVGYVKAGPVQNTKLWINNNEGNTLPHDEYTRAMIEYVPKYFEDKIRCPVMLAGIAELRPDGNCAVILDKSYNTENDDKYLCPAIRNTCYISPDGRVLPCMPIISCEGRNKFPKLSDKRLCDILSEGFYMDCVEKKISDLKRENESCAKCPHLYECEGGCRASAFVETGNITGADPVACRMWKEGTAEKILTALKKYTKRSVISDEN